MKRVAVPINLGQAKVDVVTERLRGLLAKGSRVEFVGRATDQDPALIGSAFELPAREVLILTVSNHTTHSEVLLMVTQALKDVALDHIRPGKPYTLG